VANGLAFTRFKIPAYDPEGEALRFMFATRAQYGGLVGNFTELALAAQLAAESVQGNDFGGNNTHDNMPDTPSFMSWANSATGAWLTPHVPSLLRRLVVCQQLRRHHRPSPLQLSVNLLGTDGWFS
jgi:hypothetical protein